MTLVKQQQLNERQTNVYTNRCLANKRPKTSYTTEQADGRSKEQADARCSMSKKVAVTAATAKKTPIKKSLNI